MSHNQVLAQNAPSKCAHKRQREAPPVAAGKLNTPFPTSKQVPARQAISPTVCRLSSSRIPTAWMYPPTTIRGEILGAVSSLWHAPLPRKNVLANSDRMDVSTHH